MACTGWVGSKYIAELKKWNYRLEAESKAATIFQIWWSYLYADLWKAKFKNVPDELWPLSERTMQLLQNGEIRKYGLP